MSTLLSLLFLFLIGWFWLDGARAREVSTALSREMCERHNLQFLDETVALARMGLKWGDHGIRVKRMYRFDYSEEGTGRRTGYVVLLGTELLVFQMEDGAKNSVSGKSRDDTVVPFRRKH